MALHFRKVSIVLIFLLFYSPPPATSPDVDSFPPLSSTVSSQAEKAGDKPENERSRKRRKRRKQRKRSGSVSSSSSECSEKERTSVNSAGSTVKGKSSASLLTTDKVIVSKVDNNAGKVHVNVLCSSLKEQKDNVVLFSTHTTDNKTTSQRKSTSSCDGETVGNRKSSSSTDATSNSPLQSDTDVKITVAVETAQDPFSIDKANKSIELENEGSATVDQSKKTNSIAQEGIHKKEPPKPTSWADLFKTSAKPSPGIVVKTTTPGTKTQINSASTVKKTEDAVQTVVGVEEDKYAKKFAGTKKNFLTC